MRIVNKHDFDMPHVILTKSDDMIMVHCTKNIAIVLNNKEKACSINSHIEIHNITDFELQDGNKSNKIYAHTISQAWTDKLDNVFNSETEMQDRPDMERLYVEWGAQT